MIIEKGNLTNQMDKICMESFKIPAIVLMENAATSAHNRIKKILEEENTCGKMAFVILSGPGNNGGDGLVIARKLSIDGHSIKVVFVGEEENMTESTRTNMEILKSMKVDIISFKPDHFHKLDTKLASIFSKADYIVDSLVGVGLNRDLDFSYMGLVGMINRVKEGYDTRVISIDTPSGIDATSGKVMGDAIEADYTITFEYFKKGFLNYSIEDYLGQVFVEPIGIPDKVYDYIQEDLDFKNTCFIEKSYIRGLLRSRKPNSNKSDLGRVLIYAGSKGYYGSAYLASRAATRTGSGLVTLVSDGETIDINSSRLVEEMTCLETERQRLDNLISRADAIAFGPGKADKEVAKEQIDTLLSDLNRLILDGVQSNDNGDYKKPSLVIDAGGLDVFDPKSVSESIDIVMTPHSGEFARMIGMTGKEVDENRLDLVRDYARKNGVVIVLKGKNTIVTDGHRALVNTSGNPAMANGGMGDALTGMITSLCGQGYSAFDSATLGVYLHGLIGDEIFKDNYIVNAKDLIKMIPKIIKVLYNI